MQDLEKRIKALEAEVSSLREFSDRLVLDVRQLSEANAQCSLEIKNMWEYTKTG